MSGTWTFIKIKYLKKDDFLFLFFYDSYTLNMHTSQTNKKYTISRHVVKKNFIQICNKYYNNSDNIYKNINIP